CQLCRRTPVIFGPILREGYKGAGIFGCGRRHSAAEETRKIILDEGGKCEVVSADVAEADQVKFLIDACINKFGRIDILVNNVATAGFGGPTDYPEQQWRKDFDINVTSIFLRAHNKMKNIS